MELEDLKVSWQMLDEQLKKNEIVNRKMIKEMIGKRMTTARDRMMESQIVALVFMLIMLVVLVLAGFVFEGIYKSFSPWLLLFLAVVLLAGIGYTLFTLRFISRLNPVNRSLLELREWVLLQKRMLKAELWIAPFLFVGIWLACFFFHHHYRSIQAILVDLAGIVVVSIASYLGYQYIDKRSIDEIEDGLKELEEFEEEK